MTAHTSDVPEPRYVIWWEWRRLQWTTAILDGSRIWGPGYTWTRWTRRGIERLAQRKWGIYMRLREAGLMSTRRQPSDLNIQYVEEGGA